MNSKNIIPFLFIHLLIIIINLNYFKQKSRTSSASSDGGTSDSTSVHIAKTQQDFQSNPLYPDLDPVTSPTVKSLAPRITSAPDVEAPDLNPNKQERNLIKENAHIDILDRPSFEPVKKKYLKEAWPGRKPKGQNLLSV